MLSLAEQHCLNHPAREAAARCPECKSFYCRECITEHDDRVICASCLKKLARSSGETKKPAILLRRTALLLAGILTSWLFFYWVGQILLLIPAEFHDATLWQTSFWNE
jgi:hypothetical protein